MLRERLCEQLMILGPLVHKKLNKGVPMPCLEISKQQFELLYTIFHNVGETMKFYSDQLMISKPNLTILVDKLIEEQLVERHFDVDDRRVILLKITDKGKEFLTIHKQIFKASMVKRLEALDEKEIERLSELFKEVIEIFDKLDG